MLTKSTDPSPSPSSGTLRATLLLAVPAAAGVGSGVVVYGSGIGALILILFLWVVVPLACGWFLPRWQVIGATLYNVLVFATTAAISAAHGHLLPPEHRRESFWILHSIVMALGLAAAQLARLTLQRYVCRRTERSRDRLAASLWAW